MWQRCADNLIRYGLKNHMGVASIPLSWPGEGSYIVVTQVVKAATGGVLGQIQAGTAGVPLRLN